MINAQVFDNVISEEILSCCIQEAEQERFEMLSNYTDAGTFKNSLTVYSYLHNNSFDNKNFSMLWEEVKKHISTPVRLLRCHLNAHTFGTEDGIHTDDVYVDDGLTAIVYLCREWYPEWFGETVFWDTKERMEHNEIIKSVIPKYNRLLIFDKNIPHCVAPLSRRFFGVRITCMFKLEALNDNTGNHS